MSGNSTDLRLAFSEKIGGTVLLGVDDVAQQTSDAVGAFAPGKYLIQALGLGANTCWVKTGKFVKAAGADVTLPATPGAGASVLAREFPLDAASVTSFTIHVRLGINDRIQAIMSAGTCTLVITKTGE